MGVQRESSTGPHFLRLPEAQIIGAIHDDFRSHSFKLERRTRRELQINQLERLGYGNFPTPFERMHRLEERLGGPKIFIKKDDMTGGALGGNKLRQLDHVLVE